MSPIPRKIPPRGIPPPPRYFLEPKPASHLATRAHARAHTH